MGRSSCRAGLYQVQAAIAALHARARRAEETDWSEIALLYGTLARMQPSPVVTLNHAVAVSRQDSRSLCTAVRGADASRKQRFTPGSLVLLCSGLLAIAFS
jgi:predicted RNA polymerase sigma factor